MLDEVKPVVPSDHIIAFQVPIPVTSFVYVCYFKYHVCFFT